jgi:carbon-monoxide dehydrogenase large subunit
MKFGIGAPIRRKEDPAFVSGRGRYLADHTPADTLWAVFVRSPVAHARFTIGGLDAVRAMPGVELVLSADDVADLGPLPCVGMVANADGTTSPVPRYPVLAEDVVRHVGEPVAMVVATSIAAARDAAEALDIDWDERPAVTDAAAALADGAPQIWPEAPGNVAFDSMVGDPEAVETAFAKADRIVTLDLVNNRLVTNYLETRGAIGRFEPASRRYHLICGSQGPSVIQRLLAQAVFNRPREDFHVVTPDTGGGFGTKIFIYREYPLVLVAAERTGRPVTWIADRTEHFLADYHGRDNVSHAELALDGKGRFLALKVDTIANMGAYLGQVGPFVPVNGAAMIPGVYRIPAACARVRGAYTNTVPVDAYRGAGRPEAAYLIERLVDKAALETGLRPDVIRRRNFIAPSQMPWTTPTDRTYDTGEFDGHMRRAMEVADWAGFKSRLRDSRRRGMVRGIGLATYIEACSGGGPEAATLSLDADGGITVLSGTQSTGQGHVTAYAQIVAERLGIDPARVRVIQGDTDLIPHGSFTGGSRSIPVGGAAVSQAAIKLGERLKAIAADMLEAASEDLEFGDGGIRIAGTDRQVSFAEIAANAAESGETLSERDSWKPPEATYPNGTHVVEVEIDPATGRIRFPRYTVVDDFGAVVNPLLLAGQVHGGIAQGLGQAVLERTVYDASGQLLTASLQDYALPRADDLPEFAFETRNVPCATNILGLKGAGEAGAIGATPAVVNAIVDALHRAVGITHVDMPITPEKLWRLLNGREAA